MLAIGLTSVFSTIFDLFAKIWNRVSHQPIQISLDQNVQALKNLQENFPRISTVQPPNLFQQQRCSFSSGRIDVPPMSIKAHSLLWGVRHPTNVVPKSSSSKFRKCGFPCCRKAHHEQFAYSQQSIWHFSTRGMCDDEFCQSFPIIQVSSSQWQPLCSQLGKLFWTSACNIDFLTPSKWKTFLESFGHAGSIFIFPFWRE